jgi:hypothetical protein
MHLFGYTTLFKPFQSNFHFSFEFIFTPFLLRTHFPSQTVYFLAHICLSPFQYLVTNKIALFMATVSHSLTQHPFWSPISISCTLQSCGCGCSTVMMETAGSSKTLVPSLPNYTVSHLKRLSSSLPLL